MKRLTPLWIFIAIFVIGAIYFPGLSKYLKLKRRDTELSREIEVLKTQINQLQREEHLLKTDLTKLEEALREELGLVKPGEIVVRVVEEEVSQKSAESSQKKS
ncbi:MAG: septum formation initiator family protein [Candidatus Omnitrophica bacterium]|nr:septum formation initiator family protein [Candidatus Omnitrophota bacterium]